jgi:membrane fusion protein, multidrug efflux system
LIASYLWRLVRRFNLIKNNKMTNPELLPKSPQRKRMVPLRYVLMPFAIILLAIVVLAIFAAVAPKPAKKPIQNKPPLVEVMHIKSGDVRFMVDSQGSVMPRTETVLVAEVSGVVNQVSEKFVVGGYFQQGDTLLTIDDISYQVALLQAKSRFESAQASLWEEQAKAEQAKQDWQQTGKPLEQAPILALRKPQLQRAQAEVIAAQASVKEAEVKLARTHITAPYDAMVKAKKVDIGQYVTMGTQLAVTFAVDYAEIRLPIKQQDIEFLALPKINQVNHAATQVDLSMSVNGRSLHWSSYLTRYEGEIDSNSRVHYVVAKVTDPYQLFGQQQGPELRMGSFVQALVAGKNMAGVLAIPRKAVQAANTINLIDADNKLHILQITVLHTDHDYLYSQAQLPQGMRLILTKLSTPVEGMPLRVVGESEQALLVKQDSVPLTAVAGEQQ